jgi:hypothetical protein
MDRAFPSAAPDREVLPNWAAELAADLDRDAIIEDIVQADIAAAFPQRVGDAAFADQLRESVRENVTRTLDYMAGRGDLADVELRQPVEFAKAQAQLGIPQSAMQHSYRVGYLTLWETWSRALGARAAELRIDGTEVADGLRISTLSLLRYEDMALRQVADAYMEREAALRRTGEQVRQNAVRELLHGDLSVHPDDLFLTLGYDVGHSHVVVLVRGISDTGARRLAGQLRTAAQALGCLTVRMTVTDTELWLSRLKTWPDEAVDAIRDTLRQAGVAASVSRPAAGLEGFRSGHHEVRQVEAVRAVWAGGAPPVLAYEDVQLDALLIADVPAARRFVAQQLGPLAAGTETAATLRETLLAAFGSTSHVATAERLMLHEHTVRNRLQRIEKILGRPLTERRVELQVALRLCRLLGAVDPESTQD